MISLLATLLGTRIFYHNPTRTLLGIKKPYSLGPGYDTLPKMGNVKATHF